VSRAKSQSSLQERLEIADEVINKNDELMKRWEKRLTFDNPMFSHRFVRGELCFFILFRFKYSPEYWVACFEPKPSVKFACEQMVLADRKNEPMFVYEVETVDLPERFVRALIRFEPINRFFGLIRHSLYFSNLSGFVYLGTGSDGEANIVMGLPAVKPNLGQMVGKMVESAPHILDSISSGSQNVKGENSQRAAMQAHLSRLRIVLHSDYIQLRLPVGPEFFLQLREVFFGPFDLDPNEHKPVFSRE